MYDNINEDMLERYPDEARDTMDTSDDSLGNDLKGVSGVLTRTR